MSSYYQTIATKTEYDFLKDIDLFEPYVFKNSTEAVLFFDLYYLKAEINKRILILNKEDHFKNRPVATFVEFHRNKKYPNDSGNIVSATTAWLESTTPCIIDELIQNEPSTFDSVENFIAGELVSKSDWLGAEVPLDSLYADYVGFSSDTTEYPFAKNSFSRKLHKIFPSISSRQDKATSKYFIKLPSLEETLLRWGEYAS